jgi:hypothetical protein
MRVDIYRNLNRAKQGKAEQWSIRHKGIVIGYTSAALLKDATTYVTPGAVEKIRQSGRKQVCAWVTGEWEPTAVLRTERQRGKDLPIYAMPRFTTDQEAEDYSREYYHRRQIMFNPRHVDLSVARQFYYALDAKPITRHDRFSRVYFSHTHQAWVVN